MKTMKKFGALLLVAVMLFSMAGCGAKSGNGLTVPFWIDLESEQENFVEDYFSTVKMSVGEKDKPTAAVWLEGPSLGGWLCGAVSSDESVVTVAKNGAVTAVGKGSAYVTYWGLFLTDTYLYVVEEAEASTDSNGNPYDQLHDALDELLDQMEGM